MGRIKNNINYPVLVILVISTTNTYTMETEEVDTKKIMRSMYCSVITNLLKHPSTKAQKRGEELIIQENITAREIPSEVFTKLPSGVQEKVQNIPKVSVLTENNLTKGIINNYNQSPSSSPQSRSRSNSQLDLRHRSRTSSETSETSASSTPTQSKLSLEYTSLNPEGGSDDEKDNEEKEWCMIVKDE